MHRIANAHQLLRVIFFSVFLISSNSYAQSTIYGSVTDEKGQPVVNANVLLLKNTDSSLIKGLVTPKGGAFSFTHVINGSYLIATSFSGYKQIFSQLLVITNKDLALAPIKLIEKESNLSNITVSAKKPLFEQKIDRLIINVASSITSAGSTALDVLMRSPGIVVDQQNNQVSVNGKDGVVVMLNGKIARMPLASVVQMLAGMSADNIEKIEIITTPPASLDAEGNAGYINIVTKTNLQNGTNGSYSATVGYGKGPVVATSINFNHRKGKINLYGDYSFSRVTSNTPFYFFRRVMKGSNTIDNYALSDRSPVRRNHNGRVGLDVEVNKNTIAGVLLTSFSDLFSMNALNTTNILINQQVDTIIKIANTEKHPLDNYGINLNLLRRFQKEAQVVVNLDYVSYRDANTVDYLNTYYAGNGNFIYTDKTKSRKVTPIKFWVASADYTKKLSAKINMEAGIKTTLSRFENDVQVERAAQNTWTPDSDLSARYNLKESIAAAYTSFGIKLGEKTNIKMGLRFEYINSNLGSVAVKNIVDRHYGSWFPSFFVAHAINDNNALNFSYSRRITRPTFNDMAPFVYFVDPNTFFSGNPALQPSFSNTLKGDYIVKRFIFSLSYTHEVNPITNFSPRIDPVTNKQTLAAENQKDKNVIAAIVSLPFTVTSWWNMQNNVTVLWQKLNAFYKGTPLQITQQNFNLNSTQTFSLPKNFSLELNGYYSSGGLFGIYKMQPFGSVDAGMQKKLPNNAGSLRFALSNVFGPPHFKASVNDPAKNLVLNANLVFNNRIFRLTYTRNFGNNSIKKKRDRATGSEEERQRVQNN